MGQPNASRPVQRVERRPRRAAFAIWRRSAPATDPHLWPAPRPFCGPLSSRGGDGSPASCRLAAGWESLMRLSDRQCKILEVTEAIAIVSVLSGAAVAIVVPFISARLERSRIRAQGREALRFTSYGLLWKEMRPLAIYDQSPINRETMGELSSNLSNWYFSADGGLMLTSHNRDLYFALQDLVSAVADEKSDWRAKRTSDPRPRFEEVLRRKDLTAAQALLEHLDTVKPEDWPSGDLEAMAGRWHKDIQKLAKSWAKIDSTAQFAALQQVSSVLRTGMTKDVESRLR